MPNIVVPEENSEKIRTIIQEATAKVVLNQRVFVYFYASIVPETGISWCPDCVKALPLVSEYIKKLSIEPIFIDCAAGSKEVYRSSPKHPYKIDNDIKLTALPTLIEFNKEGVIGKLIEEECYNLKKLEKFFNP